MPDRGSGAVLSRWRRVGVVLPSGIRDRVYEPALTDLWYRWVAARAEQRRQPFALHAVGTLLGCLPMAMATLFVERGRLTRFGRVSLRLVAGYAVLVIAVQLMALTFGWYE